MIALLYAVSAAPYDLGLLQFCCAFKSQNGIITIVRLLPTFLDFEASSLSRNSSYPIEVAWNDENGSIESHLISPASIRDWTDWDPDSEKVHGIPRDELIRAGKPPQEVCLRMNEQLAGKTVYCDAPRYDGMWLARLFSVGDGVLPTFELAGIDDLLVERLSPQIASRAYWLTEIWNMKVEARTRLPRQHRAAWDVEYLMEVWKIADQRRRSEEPLKP